MTVSLDLVLVLGERFELTRSLLACPSLRRQLSTCSTIFRIPNVGANLVSLNLTYVPDRNGHGVFNLHHLVTVNVESMVKLENLTLAFMTRDAHNYLDNQLARVITTLMSRGRRNSILQPQGHHLVSPLKKLALHLPLPDGFCKHVMRGIEEGYGNHRRDLGRWSWTVSSSSSVKARGKSFVRFRKGLSTTSKNSRCAALE